jgi:hypothetical protein
MSAIGSSADPRNCRSVVGVGAGQHYNILNHHALGDRPHRSPVVIVAAYHEFVVRACNHLRRWMLLLYLGWRTALSHRGQRHRLVVVGKLAGSVEPRFDIAKAKLMSRNGGRRTTETILDP